MLRPPTTRQRAKATSVHTRDQDSDGHNGGREAQRDVAIAHDGPEGNQQQEALPRVVGGPAQEPRELVQRQQERVTVSEGAGDLRRRREQQRRFLVHEDGGPALGSRCSSGGAREVRRGEGRVRRGCVGRRRGIG